MLIRFTSPALLIGKILLQSVDILILQSVKIPESITISRDIKIYNNRDYDLLQSLEIPRSITISRYTKVYNNQ